MFESVVSILVPANYCNVLRPLQATKLKFQCNQFMPDWINELADGQIRKFLHYFMKG